MSRRVGVFAAAIVAALLVMLPATEAGVSRTAVHHVLVGLQDDAQTLAGDPTVTFPLLRRLRVQVVRINLYWGGRYGVAQSRPADAADPNDPAYDWSLYDRAVRYAAENGMRVLFSIYRTPDWAGGGAGNHVPRSIADLQSFAYAAATRYSGTFVPFGQDDPLDQVQMWMAWNEPNNPIWLSPQYVRRGRKYVIQSAIDYAAICKAIDHGVHETNIPGEQVACGATGPRGNNAPQSSRPSVSPLAFMRALKRAGLKATDFDVYSHHPYYGTPSDTPTSLPRDRTDVELGNISALLGQLSALWGGKHLWITEYGFQTNPPDPLYGVSWAKQARYVAQAYAIARANPRIDLLTWFLVRDDGALSGWQSGFISQTGKIKPAFNVFAHLPH